MCNTNDASIPAPDQVHLSLMQRLRELTDLARRRTPYSSVSVPLSSPDNLTLIQDSLSSHSHPSPTLTVPTHDLDTISPIQRPIHHHYSPPHEHLPHSNVSRLDIAKEAWEKLFQSRVHLTPHQHRPLQLTNANQQSNSSWGDPLTEKEDNITRVYALNLNGISLDRRGGQFDTLCSIALEIQADIVCGQEHNVDTTQPVVRSILHNTVRQYWRRSRLITGTTPIQFNSWYKPGGTLQLSVGHITGRISATYHDVMGRWVSQTFKGRNGLQVTIISAYQVVSDAPQPGATTSAAQQRSLLIQSHSQDCNPRKAFKKDLKQYMRECRNRGDEMLLLGDFNESIDEHYNGMSQIVAEFNLVDLMRSRSSEKFPATYSRGRLRLDYGLATSHVARSLKSAGYEAFNDRYPTDHRAYFFDFDTEYLFGAQTQQLASPALRLMHSTNVKQVTQYIREKYSQLEQCNAFARGNQLSMPGNRHSFAERLDRDILQSSLTAETRVRKFQTPAWSVALANAREKVSILKKFLSMSRTGVDCSRVLQAAIDKGLFVDQIPPTTKHECLQQLKAAKQSVKTIVTESFQRREQEQQDRIAHLEQSMNSADKKHATIIRRIKRAEALKQLFEKLRNLRSTTERQGIMRIEIPEHPEDDPKTCTEWRVIDVPSEIVTNLQHRNRLHFGQAHGTPFTVQPLVQALGFTGQGEAADDILKGDLSQFRDLTGHVQLLLQHLQITTEMATMETYPTIEDDEFIGKLKVWKETTTTSPSGVHLGHYKALIARHEYSHITDDDTDEDDPDSGFTKVALRDELNRMQQSIRALHLQLINYALERGYTYQRWQKVANTMLFKEKNNIRIHRTRVIHIYEADYNLILGLKWRSALYQAEALKQLNAGQYGSRPRRNAIDPVMLEELQFEISRLSRKSMIQMNYDASACYDRIIPSLATLVSRRFGVHEQVAQVNARTLEEAKYFIRTEMGLSDTHYTHSLEFPIYGTGQGSGNSPMIWCFLSSLLFQCYETQATPANYCNPDHSNPTTWFMIGFVDDTNGQVNQFLAPETTHTLTSLHQFTQDNASTWAQLLGASGGALELPKCSYHVLSWRFSLQGAPVLSACSPELRTIDIRDPVTDQIQSMPYLPPHTAHKTLGHYKEPAGTQKEEHQQLVKKSDAITQFLWSTPVTPADAQLFYHACYLPSISYPLTSSFFTRPQLEQIQQKAMAIIAARCGYNRNTKRDILFGPVEYGGAKFHHLYHKQGCQQITYFLRQWRLQTDVGAMLKCTLAWAQMNVGVSYSILDNTSSVLPHLESKWLRSVRDYLNTIQASIQVDDPCIPTLQRQGDSYIMDHVLAALNMFSAAEIRQINYCRLYLQAVTVSDLAMANGEWLDNTKLQGNESLHSSRTRWMRVHQDRPSSKVWKVWQRANQLWSTRAGKLHVPLRNWVHKKSELRFQFAAYRTINRMWIRNQDGSFLEYRFTGTHQTATTPFNQVEFSALPEVAVPIDSSLAHNGRWWTLGPQWKYRIAPQHPECSHAATFDTYIETLDPWERDLLRHHQLHTDPFTACLETHLNLRVVSDGSAIVSIGRAAFGWMMSTSTGERIAEGMGPVRGRCVHSYRAEATGMLSVLRFLIRLKEFTQMHEPWIGILGTDSQSLIDTLSGKSHLPDRTRDAPIDLDRHRVVLNVLCPEWDVLIEIQKCFQQLPSLKLQHVEGHQDSETPYDQLSLMAQLNVDADHSASAYYDLSSTQSPLALMSPHTRAHLIINGGTVTSRYAEVIETEATSPPLRAYIQERHNWSSSVFDTIHWSAHGLTLRKMKAKRSHMVKFIHDILPTTGRLNKFDGGKRTCPLCECSNETRQHIAQCPHPTRAEWRRESKTLVQQYCSDTRTYPILAQLLLEGLTHWLSDEHQDGPDPARYPSDLHRLIRQQRKAGWDQLWLGRFVTEWTRVQGKYNEQHSGAGQRPFVRSSRTPEQWLSGLITILWNRWMVVWKARNEDLHGRDANSRLVAEREETRRQLRDIYSNRTMMDPRVQALLLSDETAHETQALTTTKNWLRIHTPIFTENVRKVKRMALSGVRSIRTYFSAIANPNSTTVQ